MAKKYSAHLNFNNEPVIRLFPNLTKRERTILKLSEFLKIKINFRGRKNVVVTMYKEHVK